MSSVEIMRDRTLIELKRKGIEVLYGPGKPQKQRYGVQTISSSRRFYGYLHVLDNSTKKYDVLINDGRCRPQVAYLMRSHLKEGGVMIVRGSNLPLKNHYSFINSYYTLEKKWRMGVLLTLVIRNRFFQVENSMAWLFFGTIRFQRILPFRNGGSFM